MRPVQRQSPRSQAGFTLIELLVVISIIAVVFNCPDDPDAERPGNLSQVVNAGYTSAYSFYVGGGRLFQTHVASGFYDWSFNGHQLFGGLRNQDDDELTRATGVFFQEHRSGGFRSSLDHVSTGDGLSRTMMLTENLQATHWMPYYAFASYPLMEGFCFLFPVHANVIKSVRSNMGSPAGVGPDPATPSRKQDGLRIDYQPFRLAWDQSGNPLAEINSEVGSAPLGTPTRPRPSSLHPGGVNLFFCDGHGIFLNQHIDATVYAYLVASRGERFGQGILSGDDF